MSELPLAETTLRNNELRFGKLIAIVYDRRLRTDSSDASAINAVSVSATQSAEQPHAYPSIRPSPTFPGQRLSSSKPPSLEQVEALGSTIDYCNRDRVTER